MIRNYLTTTLLLLFTYTAYSQQRVNLYKDTIPNCRISIPKEELPYIEIYPPKNTSAKSTAVLIFPGGAYSFLAIEEEGRSVAKALADKGIVACVVKYRLPNNNTMRDKTTGPIMDAQQALKLVRMNAEKWGIDPNMIGTMGFSAGGHLASTLGTHFKKKYIPNSEGINLRPNFMILVYPVISMSDELTHSGTKISLLGVDPSEENVNLFSNELQVSVETPPSYLTHCEDDKTVDVNNSIAFFKALQSKGVEAELHIYPKGDHGFTQRLPTNEWIDPILKFLSKEGFYSKK